MIGIRRVTPEYWHTNVALTVACKVGWQHWQNGTKPSLSVRDIVADLQYPIQPYTTGSLPSMWHRGSFILDIINGFNRQVLILVIRLLSFWREVKQVARQIKTKQVFSNFSPVLQMTMNLILIITKYIRKREEL